MCMSWTVWVTLLGVLLRSVYSPDGLGKEALSQSLWVGEDPSWSHWIWFWASWCRTVLQGGDWRLQRGVCISSAAWGGESAASPLPPKCLCMFTMSDPLWWGHQRYITAQLTFFAGVPLIHSGVGPPVLLCSVKVQNRLLFFSGHSWGGCCPDGWDGP